MMKTLKTRIEKTRAEVMVIMKANPELAQMLRLLTSINGIGKVSGAQLTAELHDLKNFASARELSAYAGVTPRQFQT